MVFLVLAFCLPAIAPAAPAQKVQASVDKTSVVLGDEVVLSIRVDGVNNPEDPPVPQAPGFETRFIGRQSLGSSSLTVIVNGRTVQNDQSEGAVVFQYGLRPLKTGKFTIPTTTLYYGKDRFDTPRFSIEVIDHTDRSDEEFVTLEADTAQVWAGQPVVVTVRWFVSRQIEGYSMQVPWLKETGRFVLSDADPAPSAASARVPLTLNGDTPVTAARTSQSYKGRNYTVLTFRKILIPLDTGTLSLDPVFVKCQVVTGTRRTAANMDDDLEALAALGMGLRQPVTEVKFLKSLPLTLQVQELPADGRPDTFGNAVGQFDFTCEASPLKLNAGDPITLTLKISGTGAVRNVRAPKLPELPGFKVYEPESRLAESIENGQMHGEKVFTQVLIPKSREARRMPAVSFTYFDTQTKAYRTITRGPIDFDVSDAPPHAASPAAPAAAPAAFQPGPADVEVKNRDLHFIKTRVGPLRTGSENRPGLPLAAAALFLGLPTLYAGLWAWRRRVDRLRNDPRLARSLAAFKTAKNELRACRKLLRAGKEKEYCLEVTRVLTRYLADKLSLPYGAAGPESLQGVVGMSPAITEPLARFWALAQEAKFSGRVPAPEILRQEHKTLARLLQSLEKTL